MSLTSLLTALAAVLAPIGAGLGVVFWSKLRARRRTPAAAGLEPWPPPAESL